jgi:hypothetical protein
VSPYLSSVAVCAAVVPVPAPAAVALCQGHNPASAHSAGLSAGQLGPPAAADAHEPAAADAPGQPARHKHTKHTIGYQGTDTRPLHTHCARTMMHVWGPDNTQGPPHAGCWRGRCPHGPFPNNDDDGVDRCPEADWVCARRGTWTCPARLFKLGAAAHLNTVQGCQQVAAAEWLHEASFSASAPERCGSTSQPKLLPVSTGAMRAQRRDHKPAPGST